MPYLHGLFLMDILFVYMNCMYRRSLSSNCFLWHCDFNFHFLPALCCLSICPAWLSQYWAWKCVLTYASSCVYWTHCGKFPGPWACIKAQRDLATLTTHARCLFNLAFRFCKSVYIVFHINTCKSVLYIVNVLKIQLLFVCF